MCSCRGAENSPKLTSAVVAVLHVRVDPSASRTRSQIELGVMHSPYFSTKLRLMKSNEAPESIKMLAVCPPQLPVLVKSPSAVCGRGSPPFLMLSWFCIPPICDVRPFFVLPSSMNVGLLR